MAGTAVGAGSNQRRVISLADLFASFYELNGIVSARVKRRDLSLIRLKPNAVSRIF